MSEQSLADVPSGLSSASHVAVSSPRAQPSSDASLHMHASTAHYPSVSPPLPPSVAPLSPANSKKRLRTSDAAAPDSIETGSHALSALRASSPPGSSLSPTRSSPTRSVSIAGRRPASTSSLSSLPGKDSSDLQRLLDESDDEEDDDADGCDDDDGDDGSEEKSPISTPQSVLTPLSSMAVAAAASSAALSPAPSPLRTSARASTGPATLPSLHSASDGLSGGGGGTEFSSQLFVIYMPKNNFKRFIISSLNTQIIRASKTEKAMPRANLPAVPSRPTSSASSSSRPHIPPLNISHHTSTPIHASVAAGPLSPSAAKKALPAASFASSPVSEQDSYTYNVAMEDVIACLQAHGVTYNAAFMWMDLSDFGQRFVQQMMDNNKATVGEGAANSPTASDAAQPANDTYGGLWYNVAHKSHLVVNYFEHPFLGEGYAAVITLDLLDGNKDASALSQAAMAESQTQTVTISNDTLYKATRNINEGGVTAHPAILTAASAPAPTASLTTLTPFPLPSLALPADAPREGRRKVRPVESIGEMLDRIAEYQRIRLQVKSKNKACERLGYSKGTINAYREKVKQALHAGIDLNQVRHTKYRDFKRLIEAAQAAGGVVAGAGRAAGAGREAGSPGGAGKVEKSVSSGAGVRAKKEDGMKRKSNSFGDLGMALMAKQDARNGGRKAKAEADGRQSEDDDSDDEELTGESSSGGGKQPHSGGRQRKLRSPVKTQEFGASAVPLGSASISASSSPPQATHHLQSILSTASFSPATSHSQLAYISPAAQHSSFTAASLPAGATYVLSPPTGQSLNPAAFSSQSFQQYSAAQFSGGAAVFAQAGGAGQFQPGSVVRAANGATYQITGPVTQVQMANVQQQPQTAFTRFM